MVFLSCNRTSVFGALFRQTLWYSTQYFLCIAYSVLRVFLVLHPNAEVLLLGFAFLLIVWYNFASP